MWFFNLNRKIKSVVKLLEHRNTPSLYIRCESKRAQPDQNIHPAPIRAQHSMWAVWSGLDHTLLIQMPDFPSTSTQKKNVKDQAACKQIFSREAKTGELPPQLRKLKRWLPLRLA